MADEPKTITPPSVQNPPPKTTVVPESVEKPPEPATPEHQKPKPTKTEHRDFEDRKEQRLEPGFHIENDRVQR